jgi:phage gpG-like protein
MPQFALKVDGNKITIGLAQFRLGIQRKTELMRAIGAGQLVSVRRTFAEQGSPAGTWAPLSPTTLRWGGKKYTPGHKLLVLSGKMLNSVTFKASKDSVAIGTDMLRARVHQLGFTGTQAVSSYSYSRSSSTRDQFQSSRITNKLGRLQTVRRKASSGVAFVQVKGFTRRVHIPARPFLVFRPEDLGRIESEVLSFVKLQAQSAGLGHA